MPSPRTIVHVDMDAFFAAVEELDHPEYRGKPLIVGADPKEGRGRGVVSTCNYAARKFGIHSAMPIGRAYKLCPHGIYVPGRYARYSELSKQVMEVLASFAPVVQKVSIDEAFLDCTGTERLFGPQPELGRAIKAKIKDTTQLIASVGIAPNKFIAKIASDLDKPDGLAICEPGREREFLAKLPLKRLWGAGARTVQKLQHLGLWDIGDVAAADPEKLERVLGKHGRHFWNLANGIDDRPVEPYGRRKSISEETTFEEDVDDSERLERVLYEIADDLAFRMRGEGCTGRTVTLKIRLTGFETFTRSRTLDHPTDDTLTMRDAALALFHDFDRRGKRVRLIGIGMSNLLWGDEEQQDETARPATQMDLFAETQEATNEPRRRREEQVLDELRRKFGSRIKRGGLL